MKTIASRDFIYFKLNLVATATKRKNE